MKKLLISLLFLLPVIAQASIIASLANQVGGRIDLYDIPMPGNIAGCEKALIAKSWGNGQADIVGCWKPNDDLVTVKWENGEYRSYQATSFAVKAPTAAKTPKASKDSM